MNGVRGVGRIVGAATVAVVLGISSAAYSAASPMATAFGSVQHIGDAHGSVGGYAVMGVHRNGSKVLTVPLTGEVTLSGELWIAPTTVSAVQGPVVPAMKSFTARADGGQEYPVIVQALAPDLDVSPLGEGQTSTGNLYFDVTGPVPTSIVYSDGTQDRRTWTASP
jgi:hypothetical protein